MKKSKAKASPASGVVSLGDSFVNVVAALGMANPKTGASTYGIQCSQAELEQAYLGSTWFGKIVDIPADDSVRAWRDWSADEAQIEKLEALEKSMNLAKKVREAIITSRLYGGAAIVPIGMPGDFSQPLNLDLVRAGSLRGLTVVNCHELQASGSIIRDPIDPWYGWPEKFTMSNGATTTYNFHPSRIIVINGRKAPSLLSNSVFWGSPIWTHMSDSVKGSDLGSAVLAALLTEAKIDVIKMPNLMVNIATAEFRDALIKRMTLAAALKSVGNALLLDSEDEWNQKQINFSGIPDVINTLLTVMSGAADIPVTRLVGTSAKGLNATGDGDLKNYYDNISARQKLDLEPAINQLDEIIIRSALGSRPPEIWYKWNPLYQMSEKEQAEIEKSFAESTRILVDAAVVPVDALAKTVQNRMVDSGAWPGLEQALEESEMELEVPDPNADDLEPGNQDNPEDDPNARMDDAEPRPLYVRRQVTNARQILSWFKKQGFSKTYKPDDLHVTIIYSKAPVDWMKFGEPWDDEMKINAGGPRQMAVFGEGAHVLLISSRQLQWRHEEGKELGASWDYPEYQPHITISLNSPNKPLEEIEPWRGPINLGPEIFEDINDDWKNEAGEA